MVSECTSQRQLCELYFTPALLLCVFLQWLQDIQAADRRNFSSSPSTFITTSSAEKVKTSSSAARITRDPSTLSLGFLLPKCQHLLALIHKAVSSISMLCVPLKSPKWCLGALRETQYLINLIMFQSKKSSTAKRATKTKSSEKKFSESCLWNRITKAFDIKTVPTERSQSFCFSKNSTESCSALDLAGWAQTTQQDITYSFCTDSRTCSVLQK